MIGVRLPFEMTLTLQQRLAIAMDRHPNLTHAELARQCHVKAPSVSAWFSGQTKSLGAAAARRAAEVFGCDQNWLGSGVGMPNWRDEPAGPKRVPIREAVLALADALEQVPEAEMPAIERLLQKLAVAPESVSARDKLAAALLASTEAHASREAALRALRRAEQQTLNANDMARANSTPKAPAKRAGRQR